MPTGQQQAWQLSAKGDEFISKFTNYVKERSSSSSSSGINTTLILMTPQNSELQSQDSYFHCDHESIVPMNRLYQVEVDRLEKGLETSKVGRALAQLDRSHTDCLAE